MDVTKGIGRPAINTVVGLETTTKSIRAGRHSKGRKKSVAYFRSWNTEAVGADEVRMNETESRLVFDNLRQ